MAARIVGVPCSSRSIVAARCRLGRGELAVELRQTRAQRQVAPTRPASTSAAKATTQQRIRSCSGDR